LAVDLTQRHKQPLQWNTNIMGKDIGNRRR